MKNPIERVENKSLSSPMTHIETTPKALAQSLQTPVIPPTGSRRAAPPPCLPTATPP
jgi:hypothetical protein